MLGEYAAVHSLRIIIFRVIYRNIGLIIPADARRRIWIFIGIDARTNARYLCKRKTEVAEQKSIMQRHCILLSIFVVCSAMGVSARTEPTAAADNV